MLEKIKPYLVTLIIVLSVALIKIYLDEVISIGSPFLLFFSAVTACALIGGRTQGFLAAFLSLLMTHEYLLSPEVFSEHSREWIARYILFILDSTIIILLCGQLRESKNKAQKALREVGLSAQAQRFLDSVIENIPNMIFVKDARDLRFVRFNKAGEELLGYPKSEMIGKNDYDFFPEEQADFFTEKDRAVLRGNRALDIPEEIIKTKRGTRYLHTRKIPLIDSDGKPQYLLGISEDITGKKDAEVQKLSLIHEQAARYEAEKSTKRLTFLSEASAVLSETLDIATMLNSVVKVVTENIGDICIIDLLEESGSHIQRMAFSYAERDPDKVKLAQEYYLRFPVTMNSKRRSIQTIKTGQSEIIKVMTDADMRSFTESEEHYQFIKKFNMQSMMASPMKYYGKIIGAITIVSATPGHHYDDLDLSIADDLTKRIAFAIENARLYLKAQEANRAKSAFLANMSHEIRTPLGAMLGFAELMNAGKNVTKDQHEYLSIIARNGKQLIRIVDEILDLSKVESDAIQIEDVSFSLKSLVSEVAALLNAQAISKKLEFGIRYQTQIPNPIISDPTRLRQILINVIGNAIKFTDRGEIQVDVSMTPSQEELQRSILQFKVQDTGIGISHEEEKKLFQPFSQADSSTTRKYGGTGLGLYFSKKLAKLLGGDLILDRSSQQGSTFIITVNVGIIEEARLDAYSEEGEKKSNQEATLGKVLIVDDVQDNRILLSYHLSRIGFSTDIAEGGRSGVEKALSGNYDLILMDVQMPEVDGFEAIKRLRAQNYKRPVIAVTAYAMKGDREKCLQSGFDDYLTKPIDKNILEKIILAYAKKKIT